MKACLVALAVLLVVRVGARTTPETSRLFTRSVDPDSGVVSYILKPGLVGHNQQSIYFTAKSMTDDGRFLVFDVSPDEFAVKDGKRVSVNESARVKAVVDFDQDKIILLPGIGGQIPFIDVRDDRIVYVNDEGFWARDLKADPLTPIHLCALPEEMVERRPGRRGQYHTHLTLTQDRRKAFVDSYANFTYRQGMVDLEKGTLETWGTTDFLCNHGQVSPVDDRLALCAWELAWIKYGWNRTRTGTASFPRADTEVYPRLWIMAPARDYRWFVPLEGHGATHENMRADGTGFYWCGGGIYFHDLRTGLQECLCPDYAGHAMETLDQCALTYDKPLGKWWRGCVWQINFWNRTTRRRVSIHSRCEAYAREDNASHLHPDPHPQFVCQDRYIVCTRAVPGRLDLSVTPTAQLFEKTAEVAPLLPPAEFSIPWDRAASEDVPYEVTIDKKKFETRSAGTVDHQLAWGVYAESATGARTRLAVQTMKSKMRTDEIILRFRVPADTAKLVGRVNEPEPFRICDATDVDNLFAGALRTKNLERWTSDAEITRAWRAGGLTLAGGTTNRTTVAAIEAAVPPAAAGRPVVFELDIRNRAKWPWNSPSHLLQFDANGKPLPTEVVPAEDLDWWRPVDTTVRHRVRGRLDPRAVRVRLEIGFTRPPAADLRDDFGRVIAEPGSNVLEVTRLALRPAAEIVFPGYDAKGQVQNWITVGQQKFKYYPDTVQMFAWPAQSHMRAKKIDVSSYGALTDTLLAGVTSDAERADRLFCWLVAQKGNKDLATVVKEAVTHFTRTAGLAAAARPDLGPGYIQVFFNAGAHAFDLATGIYEPAYGRETSASPTELLRAETIKLGDVVWENSDTNRTRIKNIPIPGLTTGRRAEVTMWVDARGLSPEGVPEASLAWGSRKTGVDWAMGSSTVRRWNDKQIEKDAQGRRRFICRTVIMPSDGTKPKLHFFAKKPAVGKIVYSDIALTLFPRSYNVTLANSAHAGAAADGEVRFAAGFLTDDELEPLAKLSGTFVYAGADGREVRQPADRLTSETAEVTLKVAEMAMGAQQVRFELAKEGVTLFSETSSFERLAKPLPRRVTFDRFGHTLVEGKPFFPVGMYWSENTLALSNSLARYVAPGVFNCLQTYEKAMTPEILDLYWAKGLRVMVSLKDIYLPEADGRKFVFLPDTITTKAQETAYVTDVVTRCKNHPALLAWYTCDEMPARYADRLEDRYRLLKKLDPEHPVYVLAFPSATRAFVRAFDVTGVDPYPVGRPGLPVDARKPGMGPVWCAGDEAVAVREQMFNLKPLWQVPQAFKWQWDHKNNWDERFPTRRELASMTWQQIAEGANGIFFYSYGQICNAAREKESELIEYFNETTVPVAREIRQVEDILLAAPGPAVVAKPTRVRVRTWQKDGAVYALVCNTHPEFRAGTVALAGNWTSCETVLGSGVTLQKGKLVLNMAPIASTIVKLR